MTAPRLRIAMVAPLHESVPPRLYGGTERVVSYLTEELVRQGHEVTLFASADSVTRARLRAGAPRGLRLDPECRDPIPPHLVMIDEVAEAAEQFDAIHFNTDYWHFPLVRHLRRPAITTLHGRIDFPEVRTLLEHFRDVPLVSISDAQRRPLPGANWRATVHHGLPRDLYSFQPRGPGNYLAFIGRISPEKRPDRAIRIAERAGLPLKIAAKVDHAERDYFEQCVRPLLRGKDVEFVGEIGERDKGEFLGNALALLFPIDWPEPFGLVMLEAMACGTPVIASPCGAVPEVIESGRNGFVVHTEDEAVAAVAHCYHLRREGCRQVFEERFTAERMAADYVAVYRSFGHKQRLAQVSVA